MSPLEPRRREVTSSVLHIADKSLRDTFHDASHSANKLYKNQLVIKLVGGSASVLIAESALRRESKGWNGGDCSRAVRRVSLDLGLLPKTSPLSIVGDICKVFGSTPNERVEKGSRSGKKGKRTGREQKRGKEEGIW